jgi:hypothetical protein
MDEAPRERGDEGYGACFDDARSRLHTLWQKRPQAFFASLKQLGCPSCLISVILRPRR